MSNGEQERVTITMVMPLEACVIIDGKVRYSFTPEQARRTAVGLEAAAAGLERVEVVVVGRDG